MSSEQVSLVVPGRNCAATLHDCLAAAVAIQKGAGSRLAEIIFVDDGSTDDSAQIATQFGVRIESGPGGGPGAARNIGWRSAARPLIWFVDADCVAQPDALARLLVPMGEAGVGGVGGSYGNLRPDSLLACLIHEEIACRHRRMPSDVNFLGGFNVLYRRAALEKVGGFDECNFNGPGSPGAEDAELSYRVRAAGYALRFEPRSVVGHHHPTRLSRYLRSQRHHGFWRVYLHLHHRRSARGDDYSDLIDHVQPPLALLALASSPAAAAPGPIRWVPVGLFALLAAAQLPMTVRLVLAAGRGRFLAFAPLGLLRAFWRGLGMLQGVIGYLIRPDRRTRAPAGPSQSRP